MSTSPLLGLDTEQLTAHHPTGIDSMGPSDVSDSGSDSVGVYSADPDSDTDSQGAGERRSVERSPEPDASDILPDQIENPVPNDDILAVPDSEPDYEPDSESDSGMQAEPNLAEAPDSSVGADLALAAGLPAPDQRGRAASAASDRPLGADDILEEAEELNFEDDDIGRER